MTHFKTLGQYDTEGEQKLTISSEKQIKGNFLFMPSGSKLDNTNSLEGSIFERKKQ